MLLGLIITLAILTGQLIRLPFGGGGITMLDIAVIISCLYGLLKFKKPNQSPAFILAILPFILTTVISLLFTPLHLQLNEYLVSFSYIIRFSFYILFGYLVYSGGFNSFQKQINNSLIFSGVSLAFLGLLQFIFLPDLGFLTKFGWDPHYFRTVSTFLDPNFAGAYFVLTLILLINSKDGTTKTILIFLALLTTFSRSSYLMFLISSLTLSFLKRSKKLGFLAILFFLVLLLGFQIYTQMISKPRNIDRNQSASFRLNTWQQGIQIFQNYPVLGIGFNAYRYALKEFNLGDEQFLNSHGAASNDSSLLFVATTTGLLGLLSYLLFLIWLIKKSVRDNFPLAAAVLGLLIHSIFANSLFFSPILLWLLLIYAVPKK